MNRAGVPKLICPICGEAESRVTNSRPSTSGDAIWRRRECEHCHARYSTEEKIRGLVVASTYCGPVPN